MKRILLLVILGFILVSVSAAQTTRLGLTQPAIGSTGWGTSLNNNFGVIDNLASCVSVKTANYTLVEADKGCTIVMNCSSCTATVSDSLSANWMAWIKNINATTLTVSRQTSGTFDGSITSFSLLTNQFAKLTSDGSNNYYLSASGVTYTACLSDLTPVAADDGLIVLLNPAQAIHIVRFSCGVQGTTSVVANLVKASTSLLTDQTCTAGDVNTVNTTTFANGSSQCGGTSSCAIAAHAPVTLHVGTISGSPTSLNACVDYTVDAP